MNESTKNLTGGQGRRQKNFQGGGGNGKKTEYSTIKKPLPGGEGATEKKTKSTKKNIEKFKPLSAILVYHV